MIYDRWAPIGELWHAWKQDTEFYCGLVLVEFDESALRQATEESVYPPTPCPTCQYQTAMRDCIDEPMDVAKGRGYYKAEPLDG